MIRASQQDAAAFERYVAQTATPDWLWGLILRMSGERDRALYLGHAAFREAYRRSSREGFAQGAQGYAPDLVNALGPWPIEPECITVPVDLWYGRADASPVHSPDFGATLAAAAECFPHRGSGGGRVDPLDAGARRSREASVSWAASRLNRACRAGVPKRRANPAFLALLNHVEISLKADSYHASDAPNVG